MSSFISSIMAKTNWWGLIIAAPVTLLLVLIAIAVVKYGIPLAEGKPLEVQALGCVSLLLFYGGALHLVGQVLGWVKPIYIY